MAINSSQGSAQFKSRFNEHQSTAAGRVAKKGGVTNHHGLDVRNTHGAIPKQGAPGTNKTQTVQKDFKSMGAPNLGNKVHAGKQARTPGKA